MIERNTGSICVLESSERVAEAVADTFVADAQTAIAQHGIFFVALSGGHTPAAVYELLARDPRRERVAWNRVQVFFGDERCVPPGDPQSNYGMAARAFLQPLKIAAENVHRIRGEQPPPQAAADYANELRSVLGDPPQFDLVMLGMGADGHTASLFPGQDPSTDQERLVRATQGPPPVTARVTITPAVINNARHVAIAVEGNAKAASLAAALNGEYDPTVRPIQIVCPRGKLTWFVDRAAAALLR